MANLTPLNLSDEDLDRLSPITERDIIITNRFITITVDPKFKNLPLAESQELADLEEDNG